MLACMRVRPPLLACQAVATRHRPDTPAILAHDGRAVTGGCKMRAWRCWHAGPTAPPQAAAPTQGPPMGRAQAPPAWPLAWPLRALHSATGAQPCGNLAPFSRARCPAATQFVPPCLVLCCTAAAALQPRTQISHSASPPSSRGQLCGFPLALGMWAAAARWETAAHPHTPPCIGCSQHARAAAPA